MRPRPRYSGIHTSMSRLRQGLSTRTLRTELSAMASGQSPRTSGHVTKSPTPPRLAYANEQKIWWQRRRWQWKVSELRSQQSECYAKTENSKKKTHKKNIADRQTAAGYKSFRRPAEYALLEKIKTKTLQQFAFPLFASTADTSSQKNDR